MLRFYRYHAHSEVQRADGLYGGLVVHDPITPLQSVEYDYDHELLLLVGDWYHWDAKRVLGMFMRMTSVGAEVRSRNNFYVEIML